MTVQSSQTYALPLLWEVFLVLGGSGTSRIFGFNYLASNKRIQLARLYEKVDNQRSDFLHKLAHKYASENEVVCIEDLNVKGMLHNHHLACSIGDASWSKFDCLLEQKVAEYGGVVVKVPRFFPTSQNCSGVCQVIFPLFLDSNI